MRTFSLSWLDCAGDGIKDDPVCGELTNCSYLNDEPRAKRKLMQCAGRPARSIWCKSAHHATLCKKGARPPIRDIHDEKTLDPSALKRL